MQCSQDFFHCVKFISMLVRLCFLAASLLLCGDALKMCPGGTVSPLYPVSGEGCPRVLRCESPLPGQKETRTLPRCGALLC